MEREKKGESEKVYDVSRCDEMEEEDGKKNDKKGSGGRRENEKGVVIELERKCYLLYDSHSHADDDDHMQNKI